MKLNTKVLALMTALAAGAASAAPTANTTTTSAGTPINNQASASFTDPTDSTKTSKATSNTVTTTVLALPSFDIVYEDGKDDGSGTPSDPANSATDKTPYFRRDITPGQTVTGGKYYLVNNGNTAMTVAVTTIKTTDISGVTYTFTDASGATINGVTSTPNGDGTFTYQVPLAYGQIITIEQTIVVGGSATPGEIVGATPVGSVTGTGTGTTGNGLPTGTTLYENQIVSTSGTISGPAQNTDLQYQALQIYTPTLTNTPVGTNTTTGTTVSTTVDTPLTDGPTVPGYTDPSGTIIEIKPKGDQQIAYPKADTIDGPDTVVFTNTITNGGTLSDPVTVSVVASNGQTISTPTTNADGTVTYTVTQTNSDGTTTTATVTLDPTPYADPTGIAPGASQNYTVTVTYPDSDGVSNPYPITVELGVDSGLDADTTPNDLTTDTIFPPYASFGDTAAQVTAASGNITENPAPAYYPGSSLTPVNTAPGATATYPMSISNSGTYPDTYTLQGYVEIPLTDGSSATVPVVYTDANGNPLPTSGSTTVNGVTVPIYTTGTVAADGVLNVLATVDVPTNAAQTTSTNPAPTLQQTATGVYSGIVMKDTTDPLAIASTGNVVIGKFTNTGTSSPAVNTQFASGNPATVTPGTPTNTQVGNPAGYDGIKNTAYLPLVNYDYMIIAKNNYNTSISNFVLSDTLDTRLNFVSGTCTVQNTSGVTIGSKVDATFSSGVVSCPSINLASGHTETLNVVVNIK